MNQQPGGYGPPPGYGQAPQYQQYGGYPPQGPPPKKGMSGWMIALIVVGILALMGVGSCVVCVAVVGKAASDAQNEQPGSRSTPGTPPSPAVAKAPPIQVTAKQLYADYHANEVAADEKYKDKRLIVTGVIVSIDKDAFGSMVLRLGVGDQFGLESVMATLDTSEKSKAMSLSKGKQEAVLCKGGEMILGSPSLDDCKLP